jgi:hypothetical protein
MLVLVSGRYAATQCKTTQEPLVIGCIVPLCRALHKGTYAEDPVMQSGSCDHAFGSHMHLNRMVASST